MKANLMTCHTLLILSLSLMDKTFFGSEDKIFMSQLLNYTLEVYSFEDGICNGYFDCNAEAAQESS